VEISQIVAARESPLAFLEISRVSQKRKASFWKDGAEVCSCDAFNSRRGYQAGRLRHTEPIHPSRGSAIELPHGAITLQIPDRLIHPSLAWSHPWKSLFLLLRCRKQSRIPARSKPRNAASTLEIPWVFSNCGAISEIQSRRYLNQEFTVDRLRARGAVPANAARVREIVLSPDAKNAPEAVA
jgi:hypothetical protein